MTTNMDCASAAPMQVLFGEVSDTGMHTGKAVRYTVATLVTDREQYDAMVSSFVAGGFGGDDCEFLYVDNTGDKQTCAFEGLNGALLQARGRYVVACHQDVRLIDDGRCALDLRLGELDGADPLWAVAGNAGGVGPGELAIRISDPHGLDQRVGRFPARVSSVDENFIVVKASSRVGFSNDLTGFHLYGADLCLNADIRGWRAYVIDFHLQHLSGGVKGGAFGQSERAFRAKWDQALRSRTIQTTCTLVCLGGGRIGWLSRRLGASVIPKSMRLYRRVGAAIGNARNWVRSNLRDERQWLRLGMGRRDA